MIPVEDLQNGDLVLTEDNGAQPIRWIGSTKLDAIDLAAKPKLRPVLIRAGVLGQGYPSQDLIVSRQHRILVRSAIVQRMFGEDEVLIPAVKLLEVDGVEVLQPTPAGVEYFHILFDEHQIVRANGAPTESLFTGPEALKAMSPDARAEIKALFPEICEPDFKPVAARPIPESGRLMKKLVQRHLSNDKPLYANEGAWPRINAGAVPKGAVGAVLAEMDAVFRADRRLRQDVSADLVRPPVSPYLDVRMSHPALAVQSRSACISRCRR